MQKTFIDEMYSKRYSSFKGFACIFVVTQRSTRLKKYLDIIARKSPVGKKKKSLVRMNVESPTEITYELGISR